VRVLIADDDPITRHLLARTLQQWGYEVTAAADGAEAWRLFERHDFPLVITDWVMPGMEGPELVRRIRGSPRTGYVFILLLAASSSRHEVVEGLQAGADDFLAKPFDRDELRVRLRTGERVLRLEQALLEQNRALTERNRQMEADLRMACEIQQALLPQGYPSFPAGVPPENSALYFCDRYRPDGAVGGDFFEVLALSDSRAGLFVCDVMGHGVRAALVTAMVRPLLEALRPVAHDAGLVLSELNRELLGILGAAGVPIFLTAFYAVLDIPTGQLSYASAGHPAPLMVRRTERAVYPLPPVVNTSWPPLGVKPELTYPAHRLPMVPGDLLIVFTDGLFDAIGPQDAPFGEDRLIDAVARNLALPAGRLIDAVLSEIIHYSEGRGFADDVCIVGMELRTALAGAQLPRA